MLTLIIIIGIILTIGFYSLYQTKKGEQEMKKISDSRPYLSKNEYIDILINKGYLSKHIEIVYDTIKEYIDWDFFVMYPEDDIYRIYGIDDLDDVELFDEISKKIGVRKVEQKDIDSLSGNFEIVNAEYILAIMKSLKSEQIHN